MKHWLFILSLAPVVACASAGPGVRPQGAPGYTASGAGASTERLQVGHALFSARCQRCHALPDPTQLSAQAWPAEVAGMARKSGLSADQVTLISDFLVAASTSGQRSN